jgi:dihydrofolate reductase
MRKIVAGLLLSLDGVYESPEKWHFPYFNDEMEAVVDRGVKASDAVLLGRQTYQEFASFWPQQSAESGGDFARHINTISKYVVSNTLDSPLDWQNSTLISGDVNEQLASLKEQPGKTIQMIGSGTLVRSLLRDGLLDELQVLVHPIVVGSGKHLFPDGMDQIPLELVDAKTFSTGVLDLTYQPVK